MDPVDFCCPSCHHCKNKTYGDTLQEKVWEWLFCQVLCKVALNLVLTLLGIKLQKERGSKNAYSSH
jgi:hypothetical protein